MGVPLLMSSGAFTGTDLCIIADVENPVNSQQRLSPFSFTKSITESILEKVSFMSSEFDEMLRIGVIGPSWWFDFWHLPSVQRHPEAKIVGVCGEKPRTAEEVKAKYGEDAEYFTDLSTMLETSNPDGVIICTPNDRHYPSAMAALTRGIGVLVEKPISMNASMAWDMAEEWEAQTVPGMVNFPYRSNPCVIKMRELIEEGFIGTPLHIHASYHGGYGIGKPPGWRGSRQHSNAGILADLGSHLIDLGRFVLSREITAVCAHNLTALWSENKEDAPTLLHTEGGHDALRDRNDDSCAFLAEMEGGVQGVFHTSWIAYQGAEGQTQKIEVHGTEGRLRFYASHLGTHLEATQKPEKDWQIVPVSGVTTPAEALCDDEDYFRPNRLNEESVTYRWLNALLENAAREEPTLREGAIVQSVIDAVLASSSTRAWRDVQYPLEE